MRIADLDPEAELDSDHDSAKFSYKQQHHLNNKVSFGGNLAVFQTLCEKQFFFKVT